MKKLVLICGPNGVGKSTVSKALHETLANSVYIDSEYCCAINPFEFTPDTVQLIQANIASLMLNSFRSPSVETVIFPYGFHGPRQGIFDSVRERLREHRISYAFCPVILTCDEEENVRRMRGDRRDEARIERAIRNTRPIYDELEYPKVDTTGLTVDEAVVEIMKIMREQDREINRSVVGKTVFQPIGIKVVYARVDLEHKQVEARIEAQGSVIMNIVVDVPAGSITKEGSFDAIARLTPTMSEDHYLDMIRYWAAFWIANGIADPQAYFDQQ